MIHFNTPIHDHENPFAAGQLSGGFIDYSLLHPDGSGQGIQFNKLFDNRKNIFRLSKDIDDINRVRNGLKIRIAGLAEDFFLSGIDRVDGIADIKKIAADHVTRPILFGRQADNGNGGDLTEEARYIRCVLQ